MSFDVIVATELVTPSSIEQESSSDAKISSVAPSLPPSSTLLSDSSSQTGTSTENTTEPSMAVPQDTTNPNLDHSLSGEREKIIAEDNQFQVVDTTVQPYQKVVQLIMNFSTESFTGTGVLIGPDTILTAAHNVYDYEKKEWAMSVQAFPDKSGTTTPYGAYDASNYYMFRSYQLTNGSSEYDMAVIKLNRPVPAELGYLSMAKEAYVGQKVQVPDYPATSYFKKLICILCSVRLKILDRNIWFTR
ncbi:hypothetical protein D3X11_00725 [Streptococcus sp. X16XC17]|uniref:trypsin-like serine peptidase n=1 Tax=unclassified Streptococcus TaxID=2608887 RepID=UPI00066FCC9F|nr:MULTISPECIES: trypsin-like serine protease [unclassified Streptococcus]TCD46038.1 hypothetical protein D3X11_00725 [Streptococcus sp. X16XC17]